jgi:predicted amidohydrolase YtcJ
MAGTLMRVSRAIAVLALLAALGGAGTAAVRQPSRDSSAAQGRADVIVVNGKIVTLDARSTIAEAVAIADGRFVAVGANDRVRALAGPSARVIDARGRTVIPGLIDSHVHALMVAEAELEQPFRNLASIAEIQSWIRERAKGLPAGTWIWTPRVFPTRVKEHRFPTREELDRAAPDHPVVVDGAYALMVNSAALKAASIAPGTPDPPGGAIVRDDAGRATGLLRNVGNLLAKYRRDDRDASQERMLDALARVQDAYARAGITSIGERGASVSGYRAYEALRRGGRLALRATVTIRIPYPRTRESVEQFVSTLPFKPRQGDEWLKVGPLKIVADGGILAGTAFMREPYGVSARALYGVDDPNYRGFMTLTREQIADAVDVGHRHGWQMAAHVTGNAGVDAVLDAYEAAQRRTPLPDRRHTLIHAYFADAATAARAARLGVPIDTQPAWYYKDADALAPALGPDRLAHFIGLRTWLDGGAVTAINTDHMFGLDPDTAMNPFNPFLTMATAVTRRTEGGQVFGAGERVSRVEALRMMTIDAARLNFDEGLKGTIEPGKLADLVILSDDLLTCPEDRIRSISADLTMVGGRVVHETAAGGQSR